MKTPTPEQVQDAIEAVTRFRHRAGSILAAEVRRLSEALENAKEGEQSANVRALQKQSACDILTADLAAHSALCGELREALLDAESVISLDTYDTLNGPQHTHPAVYSKVRAALAKTPADVGAELQRLRIAEINAIRDGDTIVRLREARDAEVTENIALRAELAEKDAERAKKGTA